MTTNGFNCDETTCIDAALVCNGRTNCNHGWDEVGCNVDGSSGEKKDSGTYSHEYQYEYLCKIRNHQLYNKC